jgi:hypothetical protein
VSLASYVFLYLNLIASRIAFKGFVTVSNVFLVIAIGLLHLRIDKNLSI